MQVFLELKNHLIKLFNHEITIHHVGSTAIPGMVGKNIVDILIGVENETENEYRKIKSEYISNLIARAKQN